MCTLYTKFAQIADDDADADAVSCVVDNIRVVEKLKQSSWLQYNHRRS